MDDVLQAFNPELDLKLERTVDVPPEFIWKGWTDPTMLKQWFTPAPWKTTDCSIDLRPGGEFRTVMEGPNGEKMDNTGCYLEVVENRKLVWTDAMMENFRPKLEPNECFMRFFTAFVILQPAGGGTKYTAIAVHADAESKRKHEEIGFHQGWSAALDQLVALYNPAGVTG